MFFKAIFLVTCLEKNSINNARIYIENNINYVYIYRLYFIYVY